MRVCTNCCEKCLFGAQAKMNFELRSLARVIAAQGLSLWSGGRRSSGVMTVTIVGWPRRALMLGRVSKGGQGWEGALLPPQKTLAFPPTRSAPAMRRTGATPEQKVGAGAHQRSRRGAAVTVGARQAHDEAT